MVLCSRNFALVVSAPGSPAPRLPRLKAPGSKNSRLEAPYRKYSRLMSPFRATWCRAWITIDRLTMNVVCCECRERVSGRSRQTHFPLVLQRQLLGSQVLLAVAISYICSYHSQVICETL